MLQPIMPTLKHRSALRGATPAKTLNGLLQSEIIGWTLLAFCTIAAIYTVTDWLHWPV